MKLLRPNPSGGITYHFLAWRRFRGPWRSYREHLGNWLETRPFESRSVLIVGPSGGYTLPEILFRKFGFGAAFDVDPCARFFFKKLHREAKILWLNADFFEVLWKVDGDFSRLFERAGLPEDTLVFFANVLGQLEYLRKDYAEIHARLGRALRKVEWISIHDRLCTRLPVKEDAATEAQSHLGEKCRVGDPTALAERFFITDLKNAPAEFEEHDLDALWSGAGLTGNRIEADRANWNYFPWRIRSRWSHLVEAVHCMPERPKDG